MNVEIIVSFILSLIVGQVVKSNDITFCDLMYRPPKIIDTRPYLAYARFLNAICAFRVHFLYILM